MGDEMGDEMGEKYKLKLSRSHWVETAFGLLSSQVLF